MPKPKSKGQRKTEPRPQINAALKSIKMKDIDYKNVTVLRLFITGRFKILPAKLTGLAAKKQRLLRREIKKARIMGLLPFTDRHIIK